MSRIDDIKRQIMTHRSMWVPKIWLSSGSSMLNLACSGDIRGAYAAGSYNFFVGDSDSGKTWLGMSCLAEATIDPRFDNYRLIYDAPEGGAIMDIGRFFGQRLVDRIEPPRVNSEGEAVHSHFVDEFYYHIDDAHAIAKKSGRPFIYVLDSQDCLDSKAAYEKFLKNKRSSRRKKGDDEDTKLAGSFGDGKAAVHSQNIRRVLGNLQETDSILLLLNQTRDSFSMFENSTYSGGRSLRFYATLQMWSRQAGKLDKNYREKKRQLGIVSKIRVIKNRVTGRNRNVLVPIYHSTGLDDVGSMVDYLIDEKAWKIGDAGVVATGLGPPIKMKKENLIQYIEENDLIDDLRLVVKTTWDEIESACVVNRKNRYL